MQVFAVQPHPICIARHRLHAEQFIVFPINGFESVISDGIEIASVGYVKLIDFGFSLLRQRMELSVFPVTNHPSFRRIVESTQDIQIVSDQLHLLDVRIDALPDKRNQRPVLPVNGRTNHRFVVNIPSNIDIQRQRLLRNRDLDRRSIPCADRNHGNLRNLCFRSIGLCPQRKRAVFLIFLNAAPQRGRFNIPIRSRRRNAEHRIDRPVVGIKRLARCREGHGLYVGQYGQHIFNGRLVRVGTGISRKTRKQANQNKSEFFHSR